jgi:hypothetical protein
MCIYVNVNAYVYIYIYLSFTYTYINITYTSHTHVHTYIGQQSVGGSRIQDGFVGRTLPHFPVGALYPAAKGFVVNSFFSGILYKLYIYIYIYIYI